MKIVTDVPGEKLELRWGIGRFLTAFPGDGATTIAAVLGLVFFFNAVLIFRLRSPGPLLLVLSGVCFAVFAVWPRPYSVNVGGRPGEVSYRECGAFGIFARGWAMALNKVSSAEAVATVDPIGVGYGGRGETRLMITLRGKNGDPKLLNLVVEFVDKAEEAVDFVFRFAAAAQFKYRRVIGNSLLQDGGPSRGGGRVVRISLLHVGQPGAVPVLRPERPASYRNVVTAGAAEPIVFEALAAEIVPPFEARLLTGRELMEVWDPGVRVGLKGATSRVALDWVRDQAMIEASGKTHVVPLSAVRAIELRRWTAHRPKHRTVYRSAVEAQVTLSGSDATPITLLSGVDAAWLENRIGLEAHQQFEAFALELARALGVPVTRSFGQKEQELIAFGIRVSGVPSYRILE